MPQQPSFSKEYSRAPKMLCVDYLTLATGLVCLSRISYTYFPLVAMWDIFFRQRASIGIT